MINLLPVDYKSDISYARRNTLLRRWIILSVIALLILAAIIGGGLLYMRKSIQDLNKELAVTNASLESQKVPEVQKRVDEISGNTKLTIQVLSREVLFSQLLKKIGSALPGGTALKSLEIDNTQGAIQLNAEAVDFNSATQLQVNLQDPKNGVFEKADINSITCGAEDTSKAPDESKTVDPYPCDVSLKALFGKNNTYNYITPGVKK